MATRWLPAWLVRLSPRAKRGRERKAIAALVDADWYLVTYQDAALAGHDAVGHFLAHGMAEGRRPNALFDPDWYVATYPEVGPRRNAVRDYVGSGWKRGRQPGPHFDPAAYLAENPDVARTGAEPLRHFLRHGRAEGRSPAGPPRAGQPPRTSANPRRGSHRSGARPSPDPCSVLRRPAGDLRPAMALLKETAEKQAALFRARDAITAEMLDRPLEADPAASSEEEDGARR